MPVQSVAFTSMQYGEGARAARSDDGATTIKTWD